MLRVRHPSKVEESIENRKSGNKQGGGRQASNDRYVRLVVSRVKGCWSGAAVAGDNQWPASQRETHICRNPTAPTHNRSKGFPAINFDKLDSI